MLDSKKIREAFPSLSLRDKNNNQIIYLDGPGGTQVPNSVIDGISEYYKKHNANTHGEFGTSIETDKIMSTLRDKVSILLNAEDKNCISIGQNMTTLNFQLARGLSKLFKEGDEVTGNETRVKVVKNKVSPPFKQAEFQIMYGLGINQEGEILDFGNKLGLVEKSGAFYKLDGESIGQGKSKASQFLKENAKVKNKLVKEIRSSYITSKSK